MKRIIAWLVCSLLLPSIAIAELTVYFLDVGQGDSAIVMCDNETMIIDGGLPSVSNKIYSFIREAKIDRIDYMIVSHPDEDHIGGLTGALNAAPVDTILSPVKEWDTRAFGKFKEYAQKQNTPIVIPYAGDKYYLGGATFTILSCDTGARTPNEMSICLRIDYGETSFLFTGDVEGYALEELMDLNVPLKATVLKVSHHGSAKSNPKEFLELVGAEYSVISVGKNKNGHPDEATLNLLKNQDVKLFRTDLQGTITCVSDGRELEFKTEHKAQSDLFAVPNQ